MTPDRRQMEILATMGIDIWGLRDKPASLQADLDDSASDHQEKPGDGLDSDFNATSGPITPSDLESLATTIKSCHQCELHQSRINAVPGAGSPDADWMFVGEAPGQNEDEQGEPFVGRAGQLLDAMIRALNTNRQEVFIANVIKCRPPGNRDPRPEEVAACEPYLHGQLRLIKPKIIIALGRISAQALLKTTAPLSQLRGKVHHYGESDIPLVVTYHPAYLLRSPQQKAKVWEDLLLARSILTNSQ